MQTSARISSVILTLFWVAFTLFAVIVPEDPMAPHGSLLLALALSACAGLLLAWRRPPIGGSIAIVAGVAYLLLNWMANAPLSTMLAAMGLLIAGPFVLTGLAFILGSRAQAEAVRVSRLWASLLAVLVVALVLTMLVLSLGLGIGRVMTG
jgi:hypothetical protein